MSRLYELKALLDSVLAGNLKDLKNVHALGSKLGLRKDDLRGFTDFSVILSKIEIKEISPGDTLELQEIY